MAPWCSSSGSAAAAAEVAHHAGLAGEAQLGVRACVVAGHHALRVFANGDAEALARQGLRLAETAAAHRRDVAASISPDGRPVAFERGGRAGTSNIFVIGLDGSEL